MGAAAKVAMEDAGYRIAYESEERCGTCNKFKPKKNECRMVEGFIKPNRVCDYWLRERHPAPLSVVRATWEDTEDS